MPSTKTPMPWDEPSRLAFYGVNPNEYRSQGDQPAQGVVTSPQQRAELARGDAMLALRTAQTVEWVLPDDDPATAHVTAAIHALANARHILFGGDPTRLPH